MSDLYNKFSNKFLLNKMINEKFKRFTISFYKYFFIDNIQYFRDYLYKELFNINVFGRIYIAKEGINGQVSVIKKKFLIFKRIICNSHIKLFNLSFNKGFDDDGKSFWVLRVVIKKNIVSDGIKDKNFHFKGVHKYLTAKKFNYLIDSKKDILIVDIRNFYEFEIGRFYNAITVPSNTFKDQLILIVNQLKYYKNSKIIIYCTGGIRCEKASAWMKYNGFLNVYQIRGGILGYVNSATKNKLPIKFIGKMFVFDHRLNESITKDIIGHCYKCNSLYDKHSNCINTKCNILHIQCSFCKKIYKGYCSYSCFKESFYNCL